MASRLAEVTAVVSAGRWEAKWDEMQAGDLVAYSAAMWGCSAEAVSASRTAGMDSRRAEC